jgi:hypothetical protein
MKNSTKEGTKTMSEWYKATWYSTLISVVVLSLLPFVGFWLGVQYGDINPPSYLFSLHSSSPSSVSVGPLSSQAGDSYYSDTAEWQTDANNTAGDFSIAYPIDFSAQDNYSATPSTDWRAGANGTPGITYFMLTIPSAFEPQTNFANAQLTVGASANAAALANCLTPDASGGPAMATSSATINGIPFTVFQSSDAGAGNLYETTSYRTVHAGKCYAVEYTIHSSQIGNYPPQYNLQPFDEGQLTDVLGRIVGTFTFM